MDDKGRTAGPIRDTASAAADRSGLYLGGRTTGQMVDVAKLNVQLFDLNGVLGHSEKSWDR